MIKRLQRNFIALSMAVIAIILVVVLVATNSANWVSTNRVADETIEVLRNNLYEPIEGEESERNPLETLTVAVHTQFYYVRFFTGSDEVVISSSMDSEIDVGDEELVLDYATTVYGEGKESGYIDAYKYEAVIVDDGTIYIFLDCHEALTAFFNYLWVSIAIAAIGLVLVFVVMFFLSKLAIRPYVKNYESQKQFTTNASHELKTPLAIIMANTELLECDVGEREEIDAIKNSVTRANGMINNLIYLSKLEEGNIQLSKVDFDLSNAAEEMTETFVPLAVSSGKTIEEDIDRGVMIHADAKSINELISILLDNAVKYSKDGGTITISVKQENKKVILRVANPTVNVPEGEHSEYFTRFYKGDSSHNSEKQGHGIGLSIAFVIAEQHDAIIRAYAYDDENIEFTVEFAAVQSN